VDREELGNLAGERGRRRSLTERKALYKKKAARQAD